MNLHINLHRLIENHTIARVGYRQQKTPEVFILSGVCWALLVNAGNILGAAGRTRTVTPFGREILSLLCLPISPPRQLHVLQKNYCKSNIMPQVRAEVKMYRHETIQNPSASLTA
jgi:hypothetical protein